MNVVEMCPCVRLAGNLDQHWKLCMDAKASLKRCYGFHEEG